MSKKGEDIKSYPHYSLPQEAFYMFENEDFGYQTEQAESEPIETSEPIESNELTEEAQPQAETEDFDEIKYNKEAVKIPASERQKYLQMGYHYANKVQPEFETLRQQNAYLDRLAQMSGYTNRDEFINAVNEAEKRQQYEAYAQQMGIDVDSYQQHIAPVFNEVHQLRQELQTVQQQKLLNDLQGQLGQLRSQYPDFNNYQQQVYELATKKGYDLEDAYLLASYQDKISNLSKQTEQEVLARVTGRDQKQVIPSNDKPSNTKLDVASMSFDDIEAISQRVRRGERITL